MISLQNAWEQCKRWMVPQSDPSAAPSFLSSRAYRREWHRRQREAIRQAVQAEQSKHAD